MRIIAKIFCIEGFDGTFGPKFIKGDYYFLAESKQGSPTGSYIIYTDDYNNKIAIHYDRYKNLFITEKELRKLKLEKINEKSDE